MLSKCQLILKFIFLQLSFDILFILFLRSYTSCPYYIYSAGTTCTYSSIQDIFHILSNCFFPLSIPWNWISTLLSKFLPAYVHYPDRSPPVIFLLFPKHTLFSRFSPLLISFLCRITFSCSSAQMLFGLNYTIYKNTRICLKKIFWVTIPWKGAPACSHIPYGCFTQNNFGYKDAKYLI